MERGKESVSVKTAKYLVNHVGFVLDASGSMSSHAKQLIEIADAEIAYLAQRSGSDELNQETRVAVYTFDDTAKCIVPERDVMRLPSIADVYELGGMTALVDATILSLDDFKLVSEKYGDHAFLLYVLTDGIENASSYQNRTALPVRLRDLPSNVTVACLVPNENGRKGAVRYGFPENNIAIWDVSSVNGIKEVGKVVRQATENFMQSRATGLRSTTSLFSMGTEAVNERTVKGTLTPLSPDDYTLIPVTKPDPSYDKGEYWWIRDFAEFSGHRYTAGHSGYYQFVYVKGKKPSEEVSPTKKVIVVHRDTGLAYGGQAARQLLNLPDNKTERIKFDRNKDYDIYILSSANNRHLIPGTNLLIKK